MQKDIRETCPANPFSDAPITAHGLDLFAGRESELALARNAMLNGGGIVFIEGGRGTGKSSLGNYLRYEMASRGACISPVGEIQFNGDVPEQYFVALALWSSINAIRGVLANSLKTKPRRNGDYDLLHRDAIRLMNWAGVHSSAMLQARVQHRYPVITVKHGFRIERLGEYANIAATRMGYEGGLVLQARVGERRVILPDEIGPLFQPHLSWIFTGPPGSGRKLAGRFENLIWLNLDPLPTSSLDLILAKRLPKNSPMWTENPAVISAQIVKYIYSLSTGDLGYTLRICSKLLNSIMAENGLITSITLKKAKKAIFSICQHDIDKKHPTPLAATVLRRLAYKGPLTTGILTRLLDKEQSSVSRALSELVRSDLATCHSIGRQHVYRACSAAKVFYSS